MIYNLSIKNKYIDFQNIHLDFSRYGVYFLSGPNGVGKSTIMKQLVFGENECFCNTSSQKGAYETSRQDLITYIEQDPISDGNSIKNFIYKGKPSVDVDILDKLIKLFSLEKIDLHKSVSTLSGGEFCKFNIIAGLLKKTPYIFMDEPTNNFDNEAVRELIEVIKSLFNNRTFIIISHDPRLLFDEAVTIEVTPGKVSQLSTNMAPLNTLPPSKNAIPKARLLFQHLCRPIVATSAVFFLIAFIFSFLLNHVLYISLHNFESLPNTHDYIVTYKVDQVYSTLNETYAEAADLEIADSAKNRMILFDDIPDIASLPSVERVIYSDEPYLYEIADNIRDDTSSLNIISFPQDCIIDFGNVISFNIDPRVLYEGRLPNDGANEVALSEDILKSNFGFSSYTEAINQKIDIAGKQYTVVGCTYYNICIVSYEQGNYFGYVEYDAENYEESVSRIEKDLAEIDATIKNAPLNLIIQTKQGAEKSVLNQLMSDYAAENYTSFEYVSTFVDAVNSKAEIITIIWNVAYILVLSLIVVLVFRKSAVLFNNELHMLEIYYINRQTPRHVFIAARILQMLIVAIIGILGAKLFVKSFSSIWFWSIIDYIVISVPFFFFYRKSYKKSRKRAQQHFT